MTAMPIEQVGCVGAASAQFQRPIKPGATGDYTLDCAAGRNFATALMGHISVFGATPLLYFYAKEFIADSANEGIAIGFFQQLAELAS